ncbi:MAG: TIM barrel protein [Actinomycetaceae bacterium]|nr:TIM barrel protein [Actinomycetaceae bacterium]
MKYAVNCSIMFKELPLLERAQAARDAGFDAVEFWWPWDVAVPTQEEIDAFVESIRSAGVQLIGLNFFAGDMPGGERGLVSVPARVDEFRANVPVAIGIGRELGCKAFNALYGNRQEGVDEVASDDIAVDNLAIAAEAAAQIGATVLLEPVSGSPAYPLKTAEDVRAVIDRVTREKGVANLGFLCDIYHLKANGDDVERVCATDGGSAAHCQIADFPGRGEPGTGELDLAGLLAAMHEAGYDGWVALEYNPTVATADSFGTLPALP